MAEKTVKCVLVGDGEVGKNAMAVRYTTGRFLSEYMPVVHEEYAMDIAVGGVPVNYHLHVTAGQEDYDRLRPLAYPDTDVFMVCFSLMSQPSWSNVLDKWYPEIRGYAAKTPIVLVGTKLDLRQSETDVQELKEKKGSSPISTSQGKELARAIEAVAYFECSALTQEGLKNTFFEAASIGLDKSSSAKPRGKSKCVTL